MIRIVVVDDHPIVRDGIIANLEAADGMAVVAAGGNAADALRLAGERHPDVMLLDLELPDENGLDVLRRVKVASPDTQVVVFTAYGGEDRVSAALRDGAASYVLKGTSSDALIASIRAAAEGASRLDAAVASALVASLRAPRGSQLTAREREILRLVADGLSNRSIAGRLRISERTVKYHVAEILGRLGAENRAQAVSIAGRRGLL